MSSEERNERSILGAIPDQKANAMGAPYAKDHIRWSRKVFLETSRN